MGTANSKKDRKNVREQTVGQVIQRELELSPDMIDDEARTVPVVFATDTPYRRWWGDEILRMDAESIRAGRLEGGAAVLWNHRWDDQIGVVESWSLDGNVARAVLRFSKTNPKAIQIWSDIKDKIIRHISVGYLVHGMKLVEEREDTDVWEVTDWEPYEISPVSVPADTGAGIGRSAELPPEASPAESGKSTHSTTAAGAAPSSRQEDDMSENEKNQSTAPAAPPATSVTSDEASKRAADAERERVNNILGLSATWGCDELARQFVSEGKSVEAFQRALLENVDKGKGKPVKENAREIGLSDKERKQFSFCRLIDALSAQPGTQDAERARNAAGFELECHEAQIQRGASPRKGGALIPHDVLTQRAWSPMNTGTSGTNTGDTGGNIVPTTFEAGSFIDILRNSSVMMQRARMLTGLVGNIEIPKQTGASAAGWIAEDADAPATSIALGQLAMSPKTLASYSEITRRLLMNATPDIEALVRSDLAATMALKVDLTALYGDPSTAGAATPRGIKFYSGINAQDFVAANPTYAELVSMETKIAVDNALTANMAYLVNPTLRGYGKTELKFDGVAGTIWEPGDTLNGYGTGVSNQITAGDVFFGNWSDFLIGMWGGFELMVDPYTHSIKGRLRVVCFQDFDFQIRRTESFCYGVMPEPEE